MPKKGKKTTKVVEPNVPHCFYYYFRDKGGRSHVCALPTFPQHFKVLNMFLLGESVASRRGNWIIWCEQANSTWMEENFGEFVLFPGPSRNLTTEQVKSLSHLVHQHINTRDVVPVQLGPSTSNRNIFLLIRISSSSQTKKNASIRSQLGSCAKFMENSKLDGCLHVFLEIVPGSVEFTSRPQVKQLQSKVKEGDIVVVTSLDRYITHFFHSSHLDLLSRISRKIDQVQEFVNDIKEKKAKVYSLSEKWTSDHSLAAISAKWHREQISLGHSTYSKNWWAIKHHADIWNEVQTSSLFFLVMFSNTFSFQNNVPDYFFNLERKVILLARTSTLFNYSEGMYYLFFLVCNQQSNVIKVNPLHIK